MTPMEKMKSRRATREMQPRQVAALSPLIVVPPIGGPRCCERCGKKRKHKNFRTLDGKICKQCLHDEQAALSRKRKRLKKRKHKSPKKQNSHKRVERNLSVPKSGDTYSSRTEILKSLGFQSYDEYLASKLWKRIRKTVYKKKGSECSLCTNKASELHHNKYSRDDLIGECISNIHPICRDCHKDIEFEAGQKNTLLQARKKFEERRRIKSVTK